ncbi:exodeoxyribonuclease VII large subunit [Oxalobacteraceae bacterium GrIS 2.11]
MLTDNNFTSAPQVISVAELNQTVSRLLERSIPLCWISGEISNFTRAASGHWYFTLKDAQAQVRAVMFKSRTQAADFLPREGEKIEVRATVTLYAPRGDYQLNVENIRRAGLGSLYEAFLQLKQKLSAAGLFDAQRKQALPSFPKCIGIVTSPQAAALRDILITLKRRAPHVRVIIYPTPVQGSGSAQKIAQAIALAVSRNECEVMIVARGGGSIEDLWSFNDEQLAYTIADCPIPIIAGIGHETDFTIADFVADVRAPTPTAAAEIAVSARVDLMLHLEKNSAQLRRSVRHRLDQESQTLDNFSRRLINPLAYIRSERAKLGGLTMQLKHIVANSRKQANFQYVHLKQRLITQSPDIDQRKYQLQQFSRHLQTKTHQFFELRQRDLNHLHAQLELLNPQRTLERGYAIITNMEGHILQHPEEFIAPGSINVKLAKGEVGLEVIKVLQTPN